jgi:hypothetical protein
MTDGGDGTFGFKWSEESKLNHHSKKIGVRGYFYNKKFRTWTKKKKSHKKCTRLYVKNMKLK